MIDYKTHWLIGEMINSLPDEVNASIDAVKEYLVKAYYRSKRERLNEWNPDSGEIFELVMTVWRICLEGTQTYQALIGMIVHKIDCKLELDRAKCAAEVIAICCNNGLLVVERKYEGYVVYTEFEIDKEFPEIDRHQILFDRPKLKTTNQLLGGRLKYHSGFTCLEHLNKMNRIPLTLNRTLIELTPEESGSVLDTPDKVYQWEKFTEDSKQKYEEIGDKEFYLEWSVDLRGRCYSQGYHVNPQGSGFKKAICQLAKREVLRDE